MNAFELRLSDRVEILAMDVSSGLSKLRHRGDRFDVIFADPPYRSSESEDLLVNLGEGRVLAEGGLLILEHHHKRELRDRYGSLVAGEGVEGRREHPHALRHRSELGRGPCARLSPMAPPRVAIYPGSFDPLTLGHVDIIERGSALFDSIIVAVLRNVEKSPLFTVEERLQMIRDTFRERGNVEADSFSGLLVDYASSRKATTIVRGIRAISDFEYEFQMALMNRRLRPDDRDGVHDAGRGVFVRELAAGEGSREPRRQRFRARAR